MWSDLPCLRIKTSSTVTFISKIGCRFTESANYDTLHANVTKEEDTTFVDLNNPKDEYNSYGEVMKTFKYEVYVENTTMIDNETQVFCEVDLHDFKKFTKMLVCNDQNAKCEYFIESIQFL